MMQEEVLGFNVPVHKSLLSPLYWMGVPRNLAIMELACALFFGLLFRKYWVIGITFTVHTLFAFIGRVDPLWYQVLLRYMAHNPYYYR